MKLFTMLFVVAVLVPTLCGCGDGPGYVYHRETVEYSGEPMYYYQPAPVYTTRTWGIGGEWNNGGYRHHEEPKVVYVRQPVPVVVVQSRPRPPVRPQPRFEPRPPPSAPLPCPPSPGQQAPNRPHTR